MSVAFSVLNHLPGSTPPTVSVRMGNMELVNPNDTTSNNGSLFFTMAYSSGPTVSGQGSGLLIIVNGSSYRYPLSSFNDQYNAWYPDLVAGSVIFFNASSLQTSSGATMLPIEASSYITIEILSNSKAIWTTSQAVTPQTIKQVIANSWVVGSPKKIFRVDASVFSENDVVVTGDFAYLYGPGTGPGSANYSNMPLQPLGGQEGYSVQLAPVSFYSYYEIKAWIFNSTGPSNHSYMVSEWYPLGHSKRFVNTNGSSNGVLFQIVTQGHARPFQLTIIFGTFNHTYKFKSQVTSNTTIASFTVPIGTEITLMEQDIGKGAFVGYSGYQYSSSGTVNIFVTHPGTEYIDFNYNAGNQATLTLNVNPDLSGIIYWTTNNESGHTNSSFPLTGLASGTVVSLSEVFLPDYNTIPSSNYTFSNWLGAVNSTNQSITVTVIGNEVENATFIGPKTYNLTIDINPNYTGDVYLVGHGIHMNITNSTAPYDEVSNVIPGTSFSLSAYGLGGYHFSGYTGTKQSFNSSITLTVNKNTTETANFVGGTGSNPAVGYSSDPSGYGESEHGAVALLMGASSLQVAVVSVYPRI